MGSSRQENGLSSASMRKPWLLEALMRVLQCAHHYNLMEKETTLRWHYFATLSPFCVMHFDKCNFLADEECW